jgi:uncharacterized NAD(P)/FAD-binding protein YdhS
VSPLEVSAARGGLRPLDLWRRLPLSDRRRFLRERLRTWEVRRHRLAPAAAASVRGLRVQGRLTVLAGGVERIRSRRGPGVKPPASPTATMTG